MGSAATFRIDGKRLTAPLVLIAALTTGCDRWEPDLDAPARTQMICMATGPSSPASTPPLIFVLDTGDDRVRWVNGPGTPVGSLAVEDHQYRFTFKAGGVVVSQASVNRFDGVMDRETGAAPFLRSNGSAGPGNLRQRFSCKPQAQGPKL